MKKSNTLRLAIFVLAAVMLFALCACANNDTNGNANQQTTDENISSIEVNESSVTKFTLGEIKLSKISINIYYADGNQDTITLTDDMLSEVDRLKFDTEGTKSIVINYGGARTVCTITIENPQKVNTYTVRFDSNGGTSVKPIVGNKVLTFTNPQREGYIFEGWYDNINCAGIKATAPYTVTEDMTFYAKWSDNRWWEVRFLDRLGNPIPALTQMIENGKDIEILPDGPIEEGYTFVEWKGQKERIDKNIDIISKYDIIRCTIYFYYNYGEENETNIERPLYYGDPFTANVEFPAKEGYNGEWQILGENGETFPIGDAFSRITSDIRIVPVYTRIQFQVIFNDDPDYKGTSEGWRSITKTVYYGSDINLSLQEYADLSLDGDTKRRVGNTAKWSIQTKLTVESSDKIIRNVSAGDPKQWDETIHEWTNIDNVIDYTYNVYNEDGSVIAVIDNGLIRDIKGSLSFTARYEKKKYKLEFHYYTAEKSYYDVKNFENVKFGTKFSLYDIDNKSPDLVYGDTPKSSYTQYPYLQDWNVKWYPTSSFLIEEEIVFDEGAYFTVTDTPSGTHIFWGAGTDLRKYTVRFFDYDVSTGSTELISTQQVAKDHSPEIPIISDLTGKQGYSLVSNNNDSWRDRPMGSEYYLHTANNFSVTHNIDFYAWYVKKNWTMTFYDYRYSYTPEMESLVEAFIPGRRPTEIVMQGTTRVCTMNSAYVRENGYKFDIPKELYFGGDTLYKIVTFIEEYEADDIVIGSDNVGCTSGLNHGYSSEAEAKNFLLSSPKFTFASAVLTIDGSADVDILPRENGKYYPIDYIAVAYDKATALRREIETFRHNALTYKNEGEEKAEARERYSRVGNQYYNILDYQYYALELLRYVVSHYTTDVASSFSFLLSDNDRISAGEIASLLNNAKGTVYSSYMSTYETATGRTYEENGGFNCLKYYSKNGGLNVVGKRQEDRYEFSEWYSSARFATDAIMTGVNGVFVNNDQLTRGLENNIGLYAKWTDMFYGTAGLIFKLVEDGEDLFHYELVDYSYDEYIKIYTAQDHTLPYSLSELRGNDGKYAESELKWYVRKLGEDFFTMLFINDNGDVEEDSAIYSVNIPEGTGIPTDEALLKETIINIPATHSSISVTVIKNDAFAYLDLVFSAVISQINLPQSLTLIEEGAFSSLSSVSDILFKEGEETGGGVLVTNEKYAVIDHTLYEIDIADNPVVLLQYCASYMRSDKVVNVGGANVNQPANVFIIPSTVRRIAKGAFMACPQSYTELVEEGDDILHVFVEKIGFADGTVDVVIGEKAFAFSYIQRVGTASVVEGRYEILTMLPDRVVAIEREAFKYCAMMSEILASNTTSRLVSIGVDAFRYSKWWRVCSNLAETTSNMMILGRVLVEFIPTDNASDIEILYLGVDGQQFLGEDTSHIVAVADSAFDNVKTNVEVNSLVLGTDFKRVGKEAFLSCGLQSVDASAVFSPDLCVIEEGAFTGGVTNFSIKCGAASGRLDMFTNSTTGWTQYTLSE